MKKQFAIALAAFALILMGCSGTSYNSQRKAENKLIENYLSRNEINVLKEEPAEDYVWGEKDYLLVPGYDNLYFHLRQRGDTSILAIQPQETVVMRYKKFALTENADTISNWTTLDQAYPTEFKYGNSSTCEAAGWHMAVKYMKYHGAECDLICESKWGFDNDQNTVTPYCYIMKMKIKR